MHPQVYRKFEEILSKYKITGRVLEVGAIPNEYSLLTSKFLKYASEKIGLNLTGPDEFEDFKIIKGNANDLKVFKDEYFDCVLCNATLEHDKNFWKSIFEMNRILKKKGLLIIGTPSYTTLKDFKYLFFFKLMKMIPIKSLTFDSLKYSTLTFRIHDAPGDYYRFSAQTFKEVFFEGFNDVFIETIMIPPRTIGYGFKD